MAGNRIFRIYAFSLLCWAVAFVMALRWGSVAHADVGLIVALRLPRVILGSAVGIALGVAGAALQALFSNPLCEPYTLGISSGSALGAVLGVVLGLEWMAAGLAGTAFIGALVFTGVLVFFSRTSRAARSSSVSGNLALLLAGVMLGFLGSSLVAVLMALGDSQGIQGAIAWLLGDLSRARLSGSIFSGIAILFFSFAIWNHRKELDALLMGEEQAVTLGIDVPSARRRLVLLVSLITAVAVSASGMIGFVGLVVPHFVRKAVGSLHFHLIPLSAIWGATVLITADVAARVIAAPYELPVGAVTAVIGAPLALWVILGGMSAQRSAAS